MVGYRDSLSLWSNHANAFRSGAGQDEIRHALYVVSTSTQDAQANKSE